MLSEWDMLRSKDVTLLDLNGQNYMDAFTLVGASML